MSVAKRLYELQQIDLEIQQQEDALDGINRRLGESKALLEARAELVADEEHLAEIERQRRDAEWEVEDLRTRIAGESRKLYGGQVKNPKELLGLEQEVEKLKAKLRQKEDGLLDLMTQVEAAQDKVKSGTDRLGKLETEWQQEQQALAEEQARVESRLAELAQTRKASASELTAQALDLYEGVRAKKGQAVVKVEQGRCQGCRLTLPMSEWQRARAGNLLQCGTCGRILYLG